MSLNVNRRDLLRAVPGGVAILAILDRLILDLGAQEDSQENIIDIRIVNTYRIGRWYFDPVGVYLKPGQKVRWICTKWGGSVTAFHPSHLNHELRIPQSAEPFDSGRLIQGVTPRARFEWVFEEEGTYDYFSRHHENLGAVGRIVVGSPGGPGEKPAGYGASEGRAPVYEDVKKLLSWLDSDKILQEQIVPYPMNLLERTFPLQESNF